MKYILITMLMILQIGCSNSTTDSIKPINGTWASNCYEATDVDGIFTGYRIENLVITDGAFATDSIDYTDVSCMTLNGNTNSSIKNYFLGAGVTASDGINAQRITLSAETIIFQVPVTITTEHVFRITGVELNFGDYVSGNIPSLDYTITYIKQ